MDININITKTTEVKDKPTTTDKKYTNLFDKKLKRLDTLNDKKAKIIAQLEDVMKKIFITEAILDEMIGIV